MKEERKKERKEGKKEGRKERKNLRPKKYSPSLACAHPNLNAHRSPSQCKKHPFTANMFYESQTQVRNTGIGSCNAGMTPYNNEEVIVLVYKHDDPKKRVFSPYMKACKSYRRVSFGRIALV